MMSSPDFSPILDVIKEVRRALPITDERVARTVNTLFYAEIASVRNNLTYETATNYTREEKGR